MGQNFRVSTQAKMANGKIFPWCIDVKAQSECEAKHKAAEHAKTKDCTIYRFNWCVKA